MIITDLSFTFTLKETQWYGRQLSVSGPVLLFVWESKCLLLVIDVAYFKESNWLGSLYLKSLAFADTRKVKWQGGFVFCKLLSSTWKTRTTEVYYFTKILRYQGSHFFTSLHFVQHIISLGAERFLFTLLSMLQEFQHYARHTCFNFSVLNVWNFRNI